MKWIWKVLTVLLISGAVSAQDSTFTIPGSYEEVYLPLMQMEADAQQVASVKDIVIKRDVGIFRLEWGTIYLMKPVAGRRVAALFQGKGVFSFTPSTDIEKEQLYRFYEQRSVAVNFDRAFLLFADSTLEELMGKLTFADGEISGDVGGDIKDALKYISYDKGNWFDTNIVRALLNGERSGYFHAQFSGDRGNPFFWRINPANIEEVQFLRRADKGWFEHDPEVVCQFHKQEDYLSGKRLDKERRRRFKIGSYKINSTIPKNLDFSATAEIELIASVDDLSWLDFSMFSDMEVLSAEWEDGTPAVFFKSKNNSTLWVKAREPLKQFVWHTLKLSYEGRLFERDSDGWMQFKHSTGWYPKSPTQTMSTFDLTFNTYDKFTLASVGKKQPEEVENEGYITTRWVVDKPVFHASFNFGYYKTHAINDDRLPPIEVMMYDQGHQEMSQILGRYGVVSGRNMEKQVGGDVANSLAFFSHVYGEVPIDKFYATEIPYLHGQAFPGLVHLSWVTFQAVDDDGGNEQFRAHEVAHQWWGLGVDNQSYHDLWLVEGIADFSGLWYMQMVMKDNDKYFKMLERWRKRIMDNRKFLFGSGQEAGPIWLGHRTSSSRTQGDYGLIVYQKGAWVMHMLRNMMIDLRTMNEDPFTDMMRDFYRTYRGRKASTQDFQKIAERHNGQKLDWFFDQWIYKTAIPKYRFSYKIHKNENKTWSILCRVIQEEVPEDFQMPVPIQIDFGKDRLVRLRKLITGRVSEFTIPGLPEKPKKLRFNDLNSVLCEVNEDKWDEKFGK